MTRIAPIIFPESIDSVDDLLAYLKSSDEELSTLTQTALINARRTTIRSIIELVEMLSLKQNAEKRPSAGGAPQ